MKRLIIFILLVTYLFSCKKKENEIGEKETVPASPSSTFTIKDYMPLKYGNYWVYEITKTDTNNIVLFTGTDSCSVYDSVFINSKWFYSISGSTYNSGNYIDSSGYIIYSDGTKMLSLVNDDTLKTVFSSVSSSWYNSYSIMKTTPTTFVFNSNTYTSCINRYLYFYSNMNLYCPNWIVYNTYCPGVGLVYSKYGFINSCDVWELKLLRYKIN